MHRAWIPGPAAEAALRRPLRHRRHPLLRHIPALLDASRAEAARRELQAKCAPLCPNGLLELAVLLSAALRRANIMRRGAFPTMSTLPRWLLFPFF